MWRIGQLAVLLALLGSFVFPAAGADGPALTVDLTGPTHPISPYIYGMNFAAPALGAELNLPLNRWGGNDTSRYDYTIDTSSKGMDYYFSNIPYRIEEGQPTRPLPAESRVNRYIEQNAAWGGDTIVTVPMLGWMPKDESYGCSFHIDIYPLQQAFEPWRDECGNGRYPDGSLIVGNDPTDASRAIDETFVSTWVNYLEATYGSAASGGVKFYNLDNEPMLWFDTHRDVFQGTLGYDGLRDRTYLYGAAVKAADPTALTLGPAGYGWEEYFYSDLDRAVGCFEGSPCTDHIAHGSVGLAEWYLQQMADYETNNGVRILDYFDEHFYPFFVALNNDVSAGMQAQRLRATRFLWDPTFNQQPDNWYVGEAFQMIPRMKQWVADNYPGTKTAITEYNFGALNHINGALTQADVLGIFGREGLDLATLWSPPNSNQPGAFSFRMYLNYDGAGSDFGDVSVTATSGNQDHLSIYAATRTSDGALTLMVINKTGVDRDTSISITGYDAHPAVDVWRYSSSDLTAVVQQPDALYSAGTVTTTFPAESITLLVLSPPPGTSTELLSNGSFESALTDWTTVNPTQDKVKCDAVNPGKVAYSGTCGLMATGTAGVTTKVKQTVTVIAGVSGDSAVIQAWAKGKNLAANVQFKATLNTTGGTQTIKFTLAQGTYGFTSDGTAANLIGDLVSGKVQIIIKPGSGKVFIDDVSLTVNGTRRGGPLAPPLAPAGWRQ